MGDSLDLDRLRLPPEDVARTDLALAVATQKPPRHRPGDKFVRGPVPWSWVCRVLGLPNTGPAALAWVLWFKVGCCGSAFSLFPADYECLRRDRKTIRRWLAELEASGLLEVDRHRGRSPTITLCEITEDGRPPATGPPAA